MGDDRRAPSGAEAAKGEEGGGSGSDTSLARMMRILDVIEDGPAGMSFDDMVARLGFTRSTLYRYLKILSDSGLLTSLPDVGYMLGPRVAELDFKMRSHDPLIIAGRPVMADLARSAPGIALLCRRYRERVLCVHQERGDAGFESTYERGRPRPLLRGAASVVILASMTGPAIARLYEREGPLFAAAGLGSSLAEVRTALRRVRQQGWESTEGQVTPGVTGIAAPVFDNKGSVLGSISVTIHRTAMPEAERRLVGQRVMAAAADVTEAIAGQPARPAGTVSNLKSRDLTAVRNL